MIKNIWLEKKKKRMNFSPPLSALPEIFPDFEHTLSSMGQSEMKEPNPFISEYPVSSEYL